jgi:hypothetical protein
MVKGVTSELHTRRVALIHKRLVSMQKNDHLRQRMCGWPSFVYVADLSDAVIVPILDDCHQVMDTWGSSGTFDPFEKIYEVCF